MKLILENEKYRARAEQIKETYPFEYVNEIDSDDINLVFSMEGIYLSDGKLNLMEDFHTLQPRLKKENLNREQIVRAMKIKDDTHLRILDATAGLGEDSFLLAASGFSVTLCEYNLVISTLLSDAISRARETDLAGIVSNMTLYEGDFLSYEPSQPFDVIYLDPMFPERQKSGSIKKKFQLLQKLEIPCENGEELFSSALLKDPKKIVVKRPAKGPYLTDKKPNYSLTGSTIRYDIYLLPRYFGDLEHQ